MSSIDCGQPIDGRSDRFAKPTRIHARFRANGRDDECRRARPAIERSPGTVPSSRPELAQILHPFDGTLVRVGQALSHGRELVGDMLDGHPLAGRQRVEFTLGLGEPANIGQKWSSLRPESPGPIITSM